MTLDGLTSRQYAIAAAVARGLTNRELAADLRLSYGLVRADLRVLYDRIGCDRRAALAAWFVANGGDPWEKT